METSQSPLPSGSPTSQNVVVDKSMKRVWIGGLPSNTSKLEFEDLCLSCGKIIRTDYRPGASFGFATFHSHEDADYAIYHLKGKLFHGQALRARWAENEEKKTPTEKQQKGSGKNANNRSANNSNNKPKKEKKPMMSLTHLTPRNEPSKLTPGNAWGNNNANNNNNIASNPAQPPLRSNQDNSTVASSTSPVVSDWNTKRLVIQGDQHLREVQAQRDRFEAERANKIKQEQMRAHDLHLQHQKELRRQRLQLEETKKENAKKIASFMKGGGLLHHMMNMMDIWTHLSHFISLADKIAVTRACSEFHAQIKRQREKMFLHVPAPAMRLTRTVHYEMDWMGERDVPILFDFRFAIASDRQIDQRCLRFLLRNEEVWTTKKPNWMLKSDDHIALRESRGFQLIGHTLYLPFRPSAAIPNDQAPHLRLIEDAAIVTEPSECALAMKENAQMCSLKDITEKRAKIGKATPSNIMWMHGIFSLQCEKRLQIEVYPELFVDRDVEFNETCEPNKVDLRLGYEDAFGVIISPPVEVAVEYVGYYCFAGNCHVSVLNKRCEGVETSSNFEVVRKRISEVRVGDLVQSESVSGSSTAGQYRPILAVVVTQRQCADEMFDMVRVSSACDGDDLLVTRGHPVRLGAQGWVRPESVGEAIALDIDEVYNFVVEGRGSIWVSGIECASLGQFCTGVDDENSFFGTSRVVDQLQARPDWPRVSMRGKQYALRTGELRR